MEDYRIRDLQCLLNLLFTEDLLFQLSKLFSIIFFFVSIPIYNGYLMMGYTTIYTSLPVFCSCIG